MSRIEAKEDFDYGGSLEQIRLEYAQLPKAYMDNAACPLIVSSIPKQAAKALCSQPIANPHSHGRLGKRSQDQVNDVRHTILALLNADPLHHEVIFTSNATAAFKLVGESIYDSNFVYLKDSHTSVVGLRNLANSFKVFSDESSLKTQQFEGETLISWPLQSNFDGKRYPGKHWVEWAHQHGHLVLLDASSYAATEFPNLDSIQSDFTVLSFYKMFGYPDLGALIVRKSSISLKLLSRKKYFGGGTVASLATSDAWVKRPSDSIASWLEDGTIPIHSIITLQAAITEYSRILGDNFGARIGQHTKAVAGYCRRKLESIEGCEVFARTSESPIVTFTLSFIGHNEFVELAGLNDIHLRGGTMCNIGAFAQSTGMSDATIIHNYTALGKRCNDDISYIGGKPTGAIRASFGMYSSCHEVDLLIELIMSIQSQKTMPPTETEPGTDMLEIEALYIYPIKSCRGARISDGILTSLGIQHDRAFCLVDLSSRQTLTLKRNRSMILIKPRIEYHHLVIELEPLNKIVNSIKIALSPDAWKETLREDQLLLNTDPEVIKFFTRALGVPCTLAKSCEEVTKEAKGNALALEGRQSSTFANSSPLLVVATASGAALDLEDLTVFRPNIVLKTFKPWIEDEWSRITLKQAKDNLHSMQYTISLIGQCKRCSMICVELDGSLNKFPYMQLCKNRKTSGKIYFGQHAELSGDCENTIIKEGDILQSA